MRIRRAPPSEARRQADWIARIDPWREMGYRATPLGRWLAGCARRERVFVAVTAGQVQGILVLQPEVLLGRFIALLAVLPAAAGQGVGRALVTDAARRTSRAGGRWLYTSSDKGNLAAAAFYRRLDFARVGKLPDMVRVGRIEILWRRSA